MPLPERLLNPIPGENPSGKNLRYDPVYDKIREARRAEEALPQGDWSYEIKKADYPLVIKLATDVLSTKTKDLQIAAWLTEAVLARDHIAGLRQALDFLKGLLETFWDTMYPEIEDDDVEMRSAPLAWVGSKLDAAVRRLPLTKNKLDLLKYQESRRVGYEADCEGNEVKTAARNAAIEDKKCTGEEFDDAVRATGDAYYEKLAGDLVGALESLQSLETFGDEKFGREAPSFANLRLALEEMQDMVKQYHKSVVEEPEAPVEEEVEEVQSESPAAASAPAAKKRAVTAEPADRDDAMQRISVVAGFLRRESPQNPVPYLLMRAARWGELRGAGSSLDLAILEAPPTEKRTHIKKMAMEGNWAEVLEGAETVMSLPCGRGWLDLQRYAVRACESLGSDYEPVAAAIRADLKALLADYPDLVNASLMDDTPAANAETQAWLTESILPPPPPPPNEPEPVPEPESIPVVTQPQNLEGEKRSDVVELAMKAARGGKVQEAISLLTQDIGNERTGRGRFQKHIQLANVFLATKHEAIAYPILVELAEEIDRRKLEEWEDPALVAQPLALLFRCSEKLGRNDAEKEKIYQKLCRLDPGQALALR
ncbi:MAG TPA: type VI secretion system protein TssA [Candidatus Methylomirabilis sp.]|nr:type VI secretion system protein TssA [Candidatus Methylomirabilis sp.]